MSGFLIDTNVASELTRPKPDSRVVNWLNRNDKKLMHFSVISLGEILKGIASLREGTRQTDLQRWLDTVLRPWFSGRLLPVSQSIAERWGLLSGQLRMAGRQVTVADGLIAATALEHGLTIVTRNVKDFTGLGVKVLNPWE